MPRRVYATKSKVYSPGIQSVYVGNLTNRSLPKYYFVKSYQLLGRGYSECEWKNRVYYFNYWSRKLVLAF